MALQKHPDHAKKDSVTASHADFVVIRQAFEDIRAMRRRRRQGAKQEQHDDDKAASFFFDDNDDEDESIEDMLHFAMSQETKREVIRAYHELSQGGKDKGGYWDMARQLAEREAAASADDNGDNKASSLSGLLEAGTSSSSASSVVRRRRRKR